ncbi:MAG: hypothetical protein KJ792_08405 [Actinobacteria bacterium]|nr:hypothetical protein [Actinomycetota bacterium]MCG2801484.1 hypothetical protein [Cellulomonas sp.]
MAIGIASVAGFALLALIGRLLSPADFGRFVAFWGILFGLGSSLSTLEQETARRTASGVDDSGTSIPAVTTVSALLAALVAAVTLLPPVAARLYGSAGSHIGIVVGLAAVGFAVQFTVRGVLMGSDSLGAYSGLVVAEALTRLVLVLAVAASIGVTLSTAAISVAAGSFAWLGWFGRARVVLPRVAIPVAEWGRAARRSTSLMLAAALNASVVTGYPTMVAGLTGHASGGASGAVFAALTVSRVPLLLVSPIQALTVPAVVRWRLAAESGGPSRLRRLLVLGTVGSGALGAIGAAIGWFWGPWLVQLVYGAAYVVSPGAVALLVLSAFLLAWVLLLSATFIALSGHAQMITMWAVAVAATALWLVVSPQPVVQTTAVGALIGPLAALAVALPLLWSLTRPRLRRAEA